jgi:hypothetical protein
MAFFKVFVTLKNLSMIEAKDWDGSVYFTENDKSIQLVLKNIVNETVQNFVLDMMTAVTLSKDVKIGVHAVSLLFA